MSNEMPSPRDEALKIAVEKIKENSSAVAPETFPSSPEVDPELQKKFPDAPKEKSPDIEPEKEEEEKAESTSEPLPAPPLDATLSFFCSIHGKQPLKEIRYTTIILSCGCEWIYDCGHLTQSRRGPE